MESGAAGVPAEQRSRVGGQVDVVVTDDLGRSRLTVFFRLLLALPHFVWLTLWALVMVFVAFANWIAVIVSGRPIAIGLIGRYLRYLTHVAAYVNLGANPFPGFTGDAGSYPIDLDIPEPGTQSRLKALFRLILAIPALMMVSIIASIGPHYGTVLGVAVLLAWFVCLARGRIAQGLRDLIAYGLWLLAEVVAYMLLLTDRYPDFNPRRPHYPMAAPGHPIRIAVEDDLQRSRLTVFFRLLLALPHMVWLTLWGIAVFFAVGANWFFTLFAGRPAEGLFRFTSAYVRYSVHVSSYVYLLANPFPGFSGTLGSYPNEARIAPPARQNRWKTGFRAILALPALLIAGTLSSALALVAVFAWFTGLFLGRAPEGIRNLGAFALRYNIQTWAYLVLLTDRYPFSGPSLELIPETPPATAPAS